MPTRNIPLPTSVFLSSYNEVLWGQPFFYMACACCVNVDTVRVHKAAHKENPNPNPNPNPNSHDHCLLSKWKCRTGARNNNNSICTAP